MRHKTRLALLLDVLLRAYILLCLSVPAVSDDLDFVSSKVRPEKYLYLFIFSGFIRENKLMDPWPIRRLNIHVYGWPQTRSYGKILLLLLLCCCTLAFLSFTRLELLLLSLGLPTCRSSDSPPAYYSGLLLASHGQRQQRHRPRLGLDRARCWQEAGAVRGARIRQTARKMPRGPRRQRSRKRQTVQ